MEDKDKACSSSLHNNIAKTPQSTSKTESNKLLKRKLFSPGHTTDDEEKKGSSIPKRRRSVHVETGSPPPVTSGCSSSGSGSSSTGAVSGSKTPGRQAPLSERQQIAKIMQQYAAEETHHGDLSPRHPSASPPHSAGKRTPFDKKMNKRNEKGETMLHVAAIRGDIKLTKRLIKAKADVNVTDNAGWTPLHEACNHGHFSIAKQLLKNGANVNVLGLENDTPLHDASVNGHTKLIQLLLRHGANPLQCNMAGKAPTDVARDESILKLLKSDINASSSGSESVTSEIRSPTSPESNMSEDEDDGKRKKDTNESLFMPRSTNMISHIGASAAAAAAASSAHSPTSTTTPTKPPISDPYAYHEETETDLPTASSSSNTPTRSHPFKHINVPHKMGESQLRLKKLYKGQRGSGSMHSPKRSSSSLLHEEQPPKKQKLFGGGLYGDKQQHHTGGGGGGGGEKPKSKYSMFDSHIGSSRRSHSPASDSQSSQDSDLYDPKLNLGDSSKTTGAGPKKVDQPSGQCKVSSSDSGSKGDGSPSVKSSKKENEALPKIPKKDDASLQKSLKRDSEAVPKYPKKGVDSGLKSASKEPELFLLKSVQKESVVDTSFQPDSQMPILSQDGFSPVQFDMNFDDVSDSDENALQIDVDSTTTTTSTKSADRSLKHDIPTSTVPSSLFQGPFKSDVSSSSLVDVKDSKARQSPQSTGSASPYHFSDSPCSLTALPYKHTEKSSDKKQPEATSSASSPFPSFTNFSKSTDKVADKYGSKGNHGNKSDKPKPKESHPQYSSDSVRQFGVVSQSDTGVKREVSSSDSLQKAAPLSTGSNTPQTTSTGATKTPPTIGGSSKTITSSMTGSKGISPPAVSGGVFKPSISSSARSPAAISSSTNNSAAASDIGDGAKSDSHSPKVDTTTTDAKPLVKVEVKEEPVSADGATVQSSATVEATDGQNPPVSVKEEKVEMKPIKLEKDRERSKSPKGLDAKRNSPKLYEGSGSNRSSPRPFPFKDTLVSGGGNGARIGPSPKWDANRASPKSDRDSPKSDRSDRSDCSSSTPKVPPLKIIIPSKGTTTQPTTDRPQHAHNKTHQQQKSGSLPYVLNPTQDSSAANPDSSGVTVTASTAAEASSSAVTGLMKASRNSSRASSVASGEVDVCEKGSVVAVAGSVSGDDKDSGNGVTSTQELATGSRRNTRSKNTDRDGSLKADEESRDSSKPDTVRSSDGGGDQQQKEEPSERRVTRSQKRSQQGREKRTNNSLLSADHNRESNNSGKEEKDDKDKEVAPSGGGGEKEASTSGARAGNGGQNHSEEIAVHPRKRKALRQRHTEQSTTVDSSYCFFPKNNTSEKTANPYEMFLDIRKKVAKRRNDMTVVTPKAPTGFSNYLMVSCNYTLQGTSSSKLNIPMLTPPNTLQDSMKEMFNEQEKARYKLRLQHVIEREKLRLSIEQEVLRVHGRAARALANQTTPLSMCAILRDEEIYNMIDPEVEEKEKIGARSRYNGRQFLSWLQDVDDKYEKIKESLLLRHHHEAESLHAVQKLEWEWKVKENDNSSAPVIENLHVPMVNVNDEFELLPSNS